MHSLDRPKLWTEAGLERLGKAFRVARNAAGLSMDRLIEQLKTMNCRLSKKTISNFENGVGMPQWNTLASLAATKLLCFPGSQQPLAAEDFSSVAAGWLNPWGPDADRSGYEGEADVPDQETPIAALIRCYRERENLSEEAFAAIVSQRSWISPEAVCQIMRSEREIPSTEDGDVELVVLRSVLKTENNQPYKLKDLRALRDGRVK